MLERVIEEVIKKHGAIVVITFSRHRHEEYINIITDRGRFCCVDKSYKTKNNWEFIRSWDMSSRVNAYIAEMQDQCNNMGLYNAPQNAMIDFILGYLYSKETVTN